MVDRSRLIKWTDEQVVACYKKLGSSNKVAKELGISQTTVLRIMAKTGTVADGLDRYRADARAFNPKQDREIRIKYESGLLITDLVNEYGVSAYAIRKSVKRAGGVLRINPSPTAKEGEIEKIISLHKAGLSQIKIALELGRSQPFIGRHLRENGIVNVMPRRENHGRWKGGRMRAGGYWRVLIDKDDPYAAMRNNTGYVLEHRLVMARSLGRVLKPNETVHHINGDCSDNRLENLQLRQGKHGKGMVMCCLDCGSVNIGNRPIAESTED